MRPPRHPHVPRASCLLTAAATSMAVPNDEDTSGLRGRFQGWVSVKRLSRISKPSENQPDLRPSFASHSLALGSHAWKGAMPFFLKTEGEPSCGIGSVLLSRYAQLLCVCSLISERPDIIACFEMEVVCTPSGIVEHKKQSLSSFVSFYSGSFFSSSCGLSPARHRRSARLRGFEPVLLGPFPDALRHLDNPRSRRTFSCLKLGPRYLTYWMSDSVVLSNNLRTARSPSRVLRGRWKLSRRPLERCSALAAGHSGGRLPPRERGARGVRAGEASSAARLLDQTTYKP